LHLLDLCLLLLQLRRLHLLVRLNQLLQLPLLHQLDQLILLLLLDHIGLWGRLLRWLLWDQFVLLLLLPR